MSVRRQSVSLERVKNILWRTVIAFVPGLAQPDDAYARRLLPDAEYRLYRKMDGRDRVHACRVARQLEALGHLTPPELLRAALLHDVGKAEVPYNPVARVLVALYTPKTMPFAPRLSGLQGAWQVKRHHDAYGASLIRAAGGSAHVAELVARHHRPGSDEVAARLREADAHF